MRHPVAPRLFGARLSHLGKDGEKNVLQAVKPIRISPPQSLRN